MTQILSFCFTTFFDSSAYRLLDIIGAEQIRDLDPTVNRDLTSANAARVYRHHLPAAVRP